MGNASPESIVVDLSKRSPQETCSAEDDFDHSKTLRSSKRCVPIEQRTLHIDDRGSFL
jgi:hypothetical protein